MVNRRRGRKRAWYNLPGLLLDFYLTPKGPRLIVAVALIIFSVGGLIDRTFLTPEQITPESARFGWDEARAKVEAPRIAAQMPKFAVLDGDGNQLSGAGKNAELWRFAKLANNGLHIPTWKQESGDCVSMGWSNAIAYLQSGQIARDQRNDVLKIPFPPYAYGTSRVLVGKRQLGRGAGSIGAWAAQASLSWGVLDIGKAAELGFRYSGQLADQWGWTGPPKPATEYGSKFRIRSVAPIQSWEDARDALVHGYPVTVASNVGFNGGPYDRDGKRWLKASGNWGHQMCLIGVEDRPGREKGAYCINSWGADAHPKPLNDEPPGGFWIGWQTVQRMVGQNDSWAYSDFDGFRGEQLADWSAFKSQVEAVTQGDEVAELLARSEQPDPQPVLMEVRTMFSPTLLWICFALGVVMLVGPWLHAERARRMGGIAALLLAACLLYGSATSEAGPRRRAARQWTQQSTQTATACNCLPGVCATGQCVNCPSGQCQSEMVCGPNGCTPRKLIEKQAAAAVFNAFSATVTVKERTKARSPMDPQVWTALPIRPHVLRTYADCYATEKDFVLVIGTEHQAQIELETSNKPVAHEAKHPLIAPGSYRIFLDGGRLALLPLTKHPVAALPVSWSAFQGI